MDNEFMVKFGNIIKKSRQKLGMTQAELGEKVNRPQSSIARLESGQLGDTHFGFIIDIAHALDMRAEDLVASSFGREISRDENAPENNSILLERIKTRLNDTDPLTQQLLVELFAQLSNWIKEVPEVPKHKK